MPPPLTRIDPDLLERAAAVIKCLGHPLRLQLLDALEGGAGTVTELQELTGATQAMVSQQLATLRGHGVVTARRDGPFVRYAIAEPKVHHILACIRGCGDVQETR
jgi:DNA-binding transcriptional ArsR family regulator